MCPFYTPILYPQGYKMGALTRNGLNEFKYHKFVFEKSCILDIFKIIKQKKTMEWNLNYKK